MDEVGGIRRGRRRCRAARQVRLRQRVADLPAERVITVAVAPGGGDVAIGRGHGLPAQGQSVDAGGRPVIILDQHFVAGIGHRNRNYGSANSPRSPINRNSPS